MVMLLRLLLFCGSYKRLCDAFSTPRASYQRAAGERTRRVVPGSSCHKLVPSMMEVVPINTEPPKRKKSSLIMDDEMKELYKTVAEQDPEWFQEFIVEFLGKDEMESILTILDDSSKLQHSNSVSPTILKAANTLTQQSSATNTKRDLEDDVSQTARPLSQPLVLLDAPPTAEQDTAPPDELTTTLVNNNKQHTTDEDSAAVYSPTDSPSRTSNVVTPATATTKNNEIIKEKEPNQTMEEMSVRSLDETEQDETRRVESVEETPPTVFTASQEEANMQNDRTIASTVEDLVVNSANDEDKSTSEGPKVVEPPLLTDTDRYLADAQSNDGNEDLLTANSTNNNDPAKAPNETIHSGQAANQTAFVHYTLRDESKPRVLALSKLTELGYSELEILELDPTALDLIATEGLRRPRIGVPQRWKSMDNGIEIRSERTSETDESPQRADSEMKETLKTKREERATKRNSRVRDRDVTRPTEEVTEKASKRPSVTDESSSPPTKTSLHDDPQESPPKRRRRRPVESYLDNEDERRTRRSYDPEKAVFSVREPKNGRRRRSIPVDDPPTTGFWPDLPTFRRLLRDESNLRLNILGRDWRDTVGKEADWRLDLYTSWLKALHYGIGEPFIQSRSDRRRAPSRRRRQRT